MVRLEINKLESNLLKRAEFTFQYGQIRNSISDILIGITAIIYIPVWLDQKSTELYNDNNIQVHLHSSMVRLEIYNLE